MFMPYEPEIVRDMAKNVCIRIFITHKNTVKYKKTLGTVILVET